MRIKPKAVQSQITVIDVNGTPAPLFAAGELLLTSAGRA